MAREGISWEWRSGRAVGKPVERRPGMNPFRETIVASPWDLPRVDVKSIHGKVFDEIAAMLITLPFVLPVIEKLGFDPVWWGIVNVVVVELGMIIPPIGIIVFVLHGLAPQVPIRTIYKGVMPFIAADLLLLALLVVFPGLVLWLPTLIRG